MAAVPDVPMHPNGQTRIGSRNIRCMVGVAEVRPCATGWMSTFNTRQYDRIKIYLYTVESSVYIQNKACKGNKRI